MTIDLSTHFSDFSAANYDDATGVVNLTIASGLTTPEDAVVGVMSGIKASCEGKRANADSPLGKTTTTNFSSTAPEKSYISATSRNPSHTPNDEIQVENYMRCSFFTKDSTSLDAVKTGD